MPMGAWLIFFIAAILEVGGETTSPYFFHIAEGYTSPNQRAGIKVSFRMFTAPTLPALCARSQQPAHLTTAEEPARLRVGERFPLSRLVVVARDASGKLLKPIPLTLEVEEITPPILDLQPDKLTGESVLPLRAGAFRFRARTICAGQEAEVVIQANVRPR